MPKVLWTTKKPEDLRVGDIGSYYPKDSAATVHVVTDKTKYHVFVNIFESFAAVEAGTPVCTGQKFTFRQHGTLHLRSVVPTNAEQADMYVKSALYQLRFKDTYEATKIKFVSAAQNNPLQAIQAYTEQIAKTQNASVLFHSRVPGGSDRELAELSVEELLGVIAAVEEEIVYRVMEASDWRSNSTDMIQNACNQYGTQGLLDMRRQLHRAADYLREAQHVAAQLD